MKKYSTEQSLTTRMSSGGGTKNRGYGVLLSYTCISVYELNFMGIIISFIAISSVKAYIKKIDNYHD